jgi:hypothetical protein
MKQSLLAGVSAIAVAAGTAWLVRYRRAPGVASSGCRSSVTTIHRGSTNVSGQQPDSAEVTRNFLL